MNIRAKVKANQCSRSGGRHANLIFLLSIFPAIFLSYWGAEMIVRRKIMNKSRVEQSVISGEWPQPRDGTKSVKSNKRTSFEVRIWSKNGKVRDPRDVMLPPKPPFHGCTECILEIRGKLQQLFSERSLVMRLSVTSYVSVLATVTYFTRCQPCFI